MIDLRCLLVVLCVTAQPVAAATIAEWQDKAARQVTSFEGSKYESVTLDGDCQGLSLGKEQYAVKVNSTKDLFNGMNAHAGSGGLDKIITEVAKNKPDEIKAFVKESIASDDNRMVRVRSWQEIHVGGKWKDLEEGECKSGKKRNVKGADLRLKPGYREDLEALLLHPASVAVQSKLILEKSKLALERATCWAKAARKADRPTFQEYMFFFDYLVQNGDSFTVANLLQTAALTIVFDDKIADANKDGTVAVKMVQLKEWLGADFPHMRNKKLAVDHSDYAKENAVLWLKRFNDGKIDKNQVRLAYLALMRAMLGNNEWAYNAMNRRGTILFTGGRVNNHPYSAEEMAELFKSAGEIDANAVKPIKCN